MCYSKEQSKNSFIINVITSCILYTYSKSNDYKILALFFGFVGLMQVFDLIFWSNQSIENTKEAQINYITTKIAILANHLQPIVLGYLIYIYNNNTIKTLSRYILLIYAFVISIYTLNIFNKVNYTLQTNIETKENDKRNTLNWEWNYQEGGKIIYFIFLITLATLAYENFKFPINILFTFMNFFSFALTYFYFKGTSVGRFWCKFVSWIPLIFLMFNYIEEIDS